MRIIPCLDVRNGMVVKGVRFANHATLGPVADFVGRYNNADELVLYDITASPEGRTASAAWVADVAAAITVPFCVAGGITSAKHAEALLAAGAAKISLNSPALARPALVQELSAAFGPERVVVGIDSEQVAPHDWRVRSHTGSAHTTQKLALRTLDWVQRVTDLGAGEIVLNSMHTDGVRRGYDIAQLQAVCATTSVPVVASGGAGSVTDFVRVFTETKVHGALAASVFHNGTVTVAEVRKALEAL